nr:hypothetical protein Iba_chr01bCG9990 [Ipomoea batatas]
MDLVWFSAFLLGCIPLFMAVLCQTSKAVVNPELPNGQVWVHLLPSVSLSAAMLLFGQILVSMISATKAVAKYLETAELPIGKTSWLFEGEKDNPVVSHLVLTILILSQWYVLLVKGDEVDPTLVQGVSLRPDSAPVVDLNRSAMPHLCQCFCKLPLAGWAARMRPGTLSDRARLAMLVCSTGPHSSFLFVFRQDRPTFLVACITVDTLKNMIFSCLSASA